MTDYVQMERDFIERTLKIIDQYERLVRGKVDLDKEYEVTLLMNCLLGLLIYPQQMAIQKNMDRWLAKEFVTNAGSEWGLRREDFKSAGYKKNKKKDGDEYT
ncbi:MAG: hypothetical protein L0154_13285 [Chloroflexi bacterium]|nr:hypothetical protein [Chloroflexota bacterium]